eukprot:jgi/Mesvir1/29120/Mv18423-RA.1
MSPGRRTAERSTTGRQQVESDYPAGEPWVFSLAHAIKRTFTASPTLSARPVARTTRSTPLGGWPVDADSRYSCRNATQQQASADLDGAFVRWNEWLGAAYEHLV